MALHPKTHAFMQPHTQASSRYPSYKRRLGTERDSARRPRLIFPTSLTGDVTSEITEADWERGWLLCRTNLKGAMSASLSIRRFWGKGERWKRKRERAEGEKRLTQMLLLEPSTPTQHDSILSSQSHFRSLGCQLQKARLK